MLGFHKRGRSLIPVSDMDKSEKTMFVLPTEEILEEDKVQTPRQKRNLVMIFLLFLAEAIMASSLESQIVILVPSSTCLSMDKSFLRSILKCAYYFGSSLGLLWGCAADRFGRRRIALIGLAGMSPCCISMGFASSFEAFASLRFVAGAMSSATTISGLAMLADVTHGTSTRTKTIARLPLVAVLGSIGPLVSSMWRQAFDGRLFEVFARFPSLSGQIACAGLVFTITGAEMWLLDETLPIQRRRSRMNKSGSASEKAALLDESVSDDNDDLSLNISIIEALNDDSAAPLPSRIGINQLLTAPTVMILLASYSILSLHSSTFEVLLPHLGHTLSSDGGMGISCTWLQPITTVVAILAAVRISMLVPFVVAKVGLLTMYRRVSFMFPVLYALVPAFGFAVSSVDGLSAISAFISVAAMYLKATLAGAAQVLVLLLVLSAAPDAFSTGTVVGIISIAELFKALAVAASGLSYYLSDDYGMIVVNSSLWTALVLVALIGMAVTWKLRETPRVGTDIPEDCLVWQDVFDSESDSGDAV